MKSSRWAIQEHPGYMFPSLSEAKKWVSAQGTSGIFHFMRLVKDVFSRTRISRVRKAYINGKPPKLEKVPAVQMNEEDLKALYEVQ